MIPLFLCPESGPPKTTKRPDLMQKQSLLNYKLTWVLHLSDTVGGVGETPSHSGAGHLLGVIKWLCVGVWGSFQDWHIFGLGEGVLS